MTPKRIAAIVCYGAALAAMSALFAIGASRTFALDRELYLVRASGWCALVSLLSALVASPIGRLLGGIRKRSFEPRVAAFRRAFGISAAALATLHAAMALNTYLATAWERLLDVAWIRGGVLAWCILAALWITSFPFLVRVARVKLWKPLHRLAYVAAFFALQHAILSPFAPRAWVLLAFGAALAIAPLRLIPRPKDQEGASGAGS